MSPFLGVRKDLPNTHQNKAVVLYLPASVLDGLFLEAIPSFSQTGLIEPTVCCPWLMLSNTRQNVVGLVGTVTDRRERRDRLWENLVLR